jgi:polysaccharide export outer membrane protein
MKLVKLSVFLFAITLVVSSCSTQNSNKMLITYDVPRSMPEVFVINKKDSAESTYSHKIKSGDRIAVKFLNNYDLTKSTFNLEANPAVEAGYVVDVNGFANMPLVGKVQISGLTREDASKKLEKLYSTILNNPIIEVSIVSIKVNVFGEVGRQGKFLIDRDNISLIDLISEAGGLTSHSKKKAIRIIRGDPSNPQIIIVDLRKVGILRYSELMIQDNDIVIVDAMKVYEISEPTTAIASMLQPLLLIVNSVAIVAALTK